MNKYGAALEYFLNVVMVYDGPDHLLWPYPLDRGRPVLWWPATRHHETVGRLIAFEKEYSIRDFMFEYMKVRGKNKRPSFPEPALKFYREKKAWAVENKMEAAHHCGKEWCVHKDHVDWKDCDGQNADKIIHGTRSKLTTAQVQAIRIDTRPRSIVANEHGITVSYVGMIQRRDFLTWVED